MLQASRDRKMLSTKRRTKSLAKLYNFTIMCNSVPCLADVMQYFVVILHRFVLIHIKPRLLQDGKCDSTETSKQCPFQSYPIRTGSCTYFIRARSVCVCVCARAVALETSQRAIAASIPSVVAPPRLYKKGGLCGTAGNPSTSRNRPNPWREAKRHIHVCRQLNDDHKLYRICILA